jgi:hypothetical protein
MFFNGVVFSHNYIFVLFVTKLKIYLWLTIDLTQSILLEINVAARAILHSTEDGKDPSCGLGPPTHSWGFLV